MISDILCDAIFKNLGYVEDWRILPIEDSREYYWTLLGEGPGYVEFAETEKQLLEDGDYYRDEIYTQRHLNKWVYRTKDYTMVLVDTHTDGNQLLRIFDNLKEIKNER